MAKKVLVLTKARYEYNEYAGGYGNAIGLANGGAFLSDGLVEAGIEAMHVATVDGNSINKEVHSYKPDVVVLEALWVTPAKVQELAKLHPKVQWVVRLHSNIPFLGMEGIAIDWVKQLAGIPEVSVAANNDQTAKELSDVLEVPITYLPNIYLPPLYCPGKGRKRHSHTLDISCFGAIRPFKNQLIQAVAAITAANRLGKKLRFHINASRVEQRGDSILRNIISLFKGTPHELVMHGWQRHEDFLLTVAKMDLGMQVSFTESFNIVAADHVHVGVPLVVSDEISWLSPFTQTSTTKVEKMVETIILQLTLGKVSADGNRRALATYNRQATDNWTSFLA